MKTETAKAKLFYKKYDDAIWMIWVPKSILKTNNTGKEIIPKWFLDKNKNNWKLKECMHPVKYRTNITEPGYSDSYTFTCSRCGEKGWDE